MFLKVGHRGASAYAGENTIESFRRAIGLGVHDKETGNSLLKSSSPLSQNLFCLYAHRFVPKLSIKPVLWLS